MVLICTNSSPLHPRLLCAKFVWNWNIGSGEEYVLKVYQYIFPFSLFFSPWKRVRSFIWKHLNFLYPRMLCATFDWNCPRGSVEENFIISSMHLCYFIIISPRGKMHGPSFEQKTRVSFLPSLVEIMPMVLEKTIFI